MSTVSSSAEETRQPGPGLLLRVCLRIGLLSFGGPAAQIALMHQEFVDRHRWLDERQYLNALSFCMLLPGPEAMQLATYVGWRLQGVAGGLIQRLEVSLLVRRPIAVLGHPKQVSEAELAFGSQFVFHGIVSVQRRRSRGRPGRQE